MQLSIKNIFLFLIFISLVFLLSEFLFIIKNKNAVLGYYYFEKARISADRGNPQEAVNFLVRWAESDMREKRDPGSIKNENLQPVLSRYPNEIILENNDKLNKDIRNYLFSIKFIKLFFNDYYSLSRVFYDLGVLSFQNDSEYLFPRFLQTAINLNPQDSYLYIELANFYYYYGQIQEAEDILLDKCEKYQTSTDWCENYYDNHIKNGDYSLTPGFLLEESGRFYNYPSLLSTLSSL